MTVRSSERLAVADVLVLSPELHAPVKVVGSVRIRRARVQPGSRCTLLAKASQPFQQDPADSKASLVRPGTQFFDLAHGVVVAADGTEQRGTPSMSCPF